MSGERARRIKLLLFDVDGVLTDGTIWLFPAPAGAQQTVQGHLAKHEGAGRLDVALAIRAELMDRAAAAAANAARDAELKAIFA